MIAQAETPFKVPEFTQTEIWLSRARLRWTAPASEGSAIERYEIQMEDETGGDIKNYTFDASVTGVCLTEIDTVYCLESSMLVAASSYQFPTGNLTPTLRCVRPRN